MPPLRQAVGDFYYSDQDTDRLAAKQRLQASKRQQSPAYVQIAMKALPGDPATEQEQLYRRIRGWRHSDRDQAARHAARRGYLFRWEDADLELRHWLCGPPRPD